MKEYKRKGARGNVKHKITRRTQGDVERSTEKGRSQESKVVDGEHQRNSQHRPPANKTKNKLRLQQRTDRKDKGENGGVARRAGTAAKTTCLAAFSSPAGNKTGPDAGPGIQGRSGIQAVAKITSPLTCRGLAEA